MPILKLTAEGIGPFKKLELDFSDGQGQPHLGPHIIAGVNGAGKSTALKTLAWSLGLGTQGFDLDEFKHRLHGDGSRADVLRSDFPRDSSMVTAYFSKGNHQYGRVYPLCCAAYSPATSIRFRDYPDLTKNLKDSSEGALAFERTVDNEKLHSFLLGLFSREAIAKQQDLPNERYALVKHQVISAVEAICSGALSVELEPTYHPVVDYAGHRSNFSQLPDGVRSTLGWLADFMMRLQVHGINQDEGILMIDEIDVHLHPKWQRRILPALQKALPKVQIVVTTHSPFVISSCPGGRVHVLDLNEETGEATARPPIDAPIGQSIAATINGIFGVDSVYDIDTEEKLEQWRTFRNRIRKNPLSLEEAARMDALAATLASRSEELRLIVGSPVALSDDLLEVLTSGYQK